MNPNSLQAQTDFLNETATQVAIFNLHNTVYQSFKVTRPLLVDIYQSFEDRTYTSVLDLTDQDGGSSNYNQYTISSNPMQAIDTLLENIRVDIEFYDSFPDGWLTPEGQDIKRFLDLYFEPAPQDEIPVRNQFQKALQQFQDRELIARFAGRLQPQEFIQGEALIRPTSEPIPGFEPFDAARYTGGSNINSTSASIVNEISSQLAEANQYALESDIKDAI